MGGREVRASLGAGAGTRVVVEATGIGLVGKSTANINAGRITYIQILYCPVTILWHALINHFFDD